MFPAIKRSLLLISAVALLASCSQPKSLLNQIDSRDTKARLTPREETSPRFLAQGAKAVNPSQAVNYDSYATVLSEYVNDKGLVAYPKLQSNRQHLDKFNNSIGSIDSETFLNWSEDEQMALLMNAYNSYTLAAIINQDPLQDSIRDIPRVWKQEKYQVVGQNKSLDGIEHGTLRKDYNEPRLHAALVCAAMSCPPLRTEPYRGDNLDAQLDDQVTTWLRNPQRGLNINRENNTVAISKIFDWYGEDWIPSYGIDEGFTGNEKQRATLNFISNYVNPEAAEYLRGGNYQLQYLDYDWSLNIQPQG